MKQCFRFKPIPGLPVIGTAQGVIEHLGYTYTPLVEMADARGMYLAMWEADDSATDAAEEIRAACAHLAYDTVSREEAVMFFKGVTKGEAKPAPTDPDTTFWDGEDFVTPLPAGMEMSRLEKAGGMAALPTFKPENPLPPKVPLPPLPPREPEAPAEAPKAPEVPKVPLTR